MDEGEGMTGQGKGPCGAALGSVLDCGGHTNRHEEELSANPAALYLMMGLHMIKPSENDSIVKWKNEPNPPNPACAHLATQHTAAPAFPCGHRTDRALCLAPASRDRTGPHIPVQEKVHIQNPTRGFY